MARARVTRGMILKGRVYTPTIPANISVGDVVTNDPSNAGKVIRADASDATKMPAIGVVTQKSGSGKVTVEGRHGVLVTVSGWSWTLDQPLYVSATTPGAMVHTPDAGTTVVQRVGFATAATSIVVAVHSEVEL